jgi:hypothetical protein
MRDITALAELPGLRTLNACYAQITDFAPLAGMTALTSLELGGTRIADAAPLARMTALTSLNLGHTRIADLEFLLALPRFAAEQAEWLAFADTPAADPARDRRLDLLSRLPPDRCAVETVQYLKGTHPDFRDPPGGARGVGLPVRLAEASPVEVEIRDGRPEAANRGPPERLAPVELAQRLAALRGEARALLAYSAQTQLSALHRGALEHYIAALSLEPPTYLLLDGPMAILAAGARAPYVTDALEDGFVAGWRQMVRAHDELRPLLLPPEEPAAPAPAPDATPEAALDLTRQAREVLEPAAEDGDVGRSTVEVLHAVRDILEAAKARPEERPTLLRRGMAGLGGLLATLLQHGAAAASLQAWALTPQGQAVLAKLAPIFEALLKLLR